MALSNDEILQIKRIVKSSLDKAENVWRNHGKELVKAGILAEDYSARADSAHEVVQSKIPHHPLVDGDRPKVADFIALVADMRNSSTHLLCAISEKKSDVSLLERLYYETSALLPALEMTLSYNDGAVTEYLGDGLLSLFFVDESDKEEAIRKAYRSARNCLGDTRNIVNEELMSRYRLPPLDIGIGLSYSKALVQLVGIVGERHPKVIGNCVYYASKLSGGINEIYIDNTIRILWPVSEGGKLRFTKKAIRNTDGFLVSQK
jgi:hypothetical protein